jgi:hypothetical protein
MADGVVDRADEEPVVLGAAAAGAGAAASAIAAAAAGERQRRERERTGNSVLARTTTIPGRVACTNVTESL